MNTKNLATIVAILGVGVAAAAALFWLRRPQTPTHTVTDGETLVDIASAHGVSVDKLIAWNNLANEPLAAGTELFLAHPDQPRVERSVVGAATGVGKELPFSKPRAERCLAGPSFADLADEDSEPAMAASMGLGLDQVQGSMNSFLPKLFICVPSGYEPNGTIDLAITVGCDGVVKTVEVEDDDGLDDRLVGCVQDALGFVDFPAHDMPDGFLFQYPMVFTW